MKKFFSNLFSLPTRFWKFFINMPTGKDGTEPGIFVWILVYVMLSAGTFFVTQTYFPAGLVMIAVLIIPFTVKSARSLWSLFFPSLAGWISVGMLTAIALLVKPDEMSASQAGTAILVYILLVIFFWMSEQAVRQLISEFSQRMTTRITERLVADWQSRKNEPIMIVIAISGDEPPATADDDIIEGKTS